MWTAALGPQLCNEEGAMYELVALLIAWIILSVVGPSYAGIWVRA
jgi:hypothetical protein